MIRFSSQTIRAFVPEPTVSYQCARVYPSVFTERQCDRIVELAAGLDRDEASVGDGQGSAASTDGIRRSSVAWVPAGEPFLWIYDKLTALVRRANRHFGYDLIGFTEDIQFTEYKGRGAFYTWHQDGLDGDLAVRKLSIVVQLSDPADYAGGALEFFGHEGDDGDDAVDLRATMRRRGTAVVFPAFEYHRVAPLARGTRRSLVCWVGGPPFR